jgi:exodeoxyribonuclease-5
MQSGLNKSNISYTTVIPNEAYSPLMKDPILKFGEYLQKEESVKTLENFYKLFRRNNPNFFTIEQSFPNKEPYRFKDYEDLNKFDIFADMSNLAAASIVIPEKEIVTAVPVSDNPKDFVNHSGGAYGGDTFWDLIGREFGVTNHKHYKDAGNANLSQQLRNKSVKAEILTEEQMNFARQKVKELLGIDYSIKPSDTEKQILQKNLQVRNFYQVYNADAVYAIAKINNDNKSVSGGTNTAIQLGIKLNKPVYVWDINSETWNKFETNLEDALAGKTVSEFYEVETPTLTQNFAGIGSRDIENYNVQVEGKWQPREEYVGKDKEEKAKQAIRDVYENTFKATQPSTTSVESKISSSVSKFVNPRELKEGNIYQLTNGNTAKFVGYRFAETDSYQKSKLEIAVFEINGKNEFRAINAGKNYNIDVWNKGNIFITNSDRKLYNLTTNHSDLTINFKTQEQPINKEIKPTTQTPTSVEIIPLNESQRFTRESAEKDTEYMYLFTDNAGRTSGSGVIDPNSWYAKKYGTDKKYAEKTQAVARGLNNVYPITTMVDDKRTQWTDTQFDAYKKIIDDEIETIKQASKKYKGIKFGAEMPFGKGAISNMKDSAPKIWNYLNTKLAEIGIDNTGDMPTVIDQPSITEVVPTVSVENTFKTKIDQFTYTLNTTTGEVIHNSKTGDRLETNETQIGKVYKEYALANNYETKEFNKQNYAKVFDKVVNINNGSIVTMPNIVILFDKGTENLKNIVKSGAIVLNTGQKEALAKFTEFLDKEKNKNFLLKGRAGTGKTTIASTMMQVAKEKGYRIFATAISDAATTNLSVLSKNTPGSNIEIYNFAAMYGLVPQYDDDGNMTGFDFPSENSQTESAPKISNSSKTILIFDEASMVSQETLSKIKKLTPDITILYMGDNAQIMPIGDTKISTVFALEDQHELTEVMRQKEDSPILNIASNIAREIDVYDSTGELKLSPILDNVYTDFNESKNSGSIVTNSKETFINEAVEDFKKYGNKQTLVITGNNDNVESLNKKIREKIVNSDEQFIIGERLMTYTKYSKFMGKNKPKIEIFNSSVVTILSVSPSNVDGVPTNELLVEYTDQKGEIKQTYMNVIHRSNIQDKNKFYANRKKLDAEYKKTRDRSILDKLNPYRQTVLVDYAYAMTAHKAQGQTVRNTYVLPVYRGFSNLEARRMFYTSITRPTDKLVIFDQKANESNTTNNFSDQPFNISSEELGLNTNVSQEDAKCNS